MVALSVTTAIVLAGCGQGAPQLSPEASEQAGRAVPPDDRFNYAATKDRAGDYAPDTEVQRENWRLKWVRLGHGNAFADWRTDRSVSAKAPLVFLFEDMEAPADEYGKRRTLTVLPVSYDISDTQVAAEAVSGGVGVIALEGDWTAAGFKGRLSLGQQDFGDIDFQTKTGSR